jgi:hypothetical protein
VEEIVLLSLKSEDVMPPKLIHYHIPKTAGTSLKRTLEAWYGDLVREGQANLADRDLSGSCVTGHFDSLLSGTTSSLLETFSGAVCNPDYRVITILRNPLDHIVSTYYHHKEKALDKDIRSLRDFVVQHNRFLYRHSLQVRQDVKVADVLNSFLFVGDASDMEGSLAYLADLTGKKRLPAAMQNVGDRDVQFAAITRADRKKIEELLSPEFELYEKARDMIARRDFTGSPDQRSNQFSYVRRYSEDPYPGDHLIDERLCELAPLAVPSTPQAALDVIEKKDQRIHEQTQALAEMRAQIAVLIEQQASLTKKNARLRDVAEAFRAAAQDKASVISRLREDNKQLAALLNEANASIVNATQPMKTAEASIKSLTLKVEALSTRLEEKDVSLNAFRTLSEKQAEKIHSLRERIDFLTALLPASQHSS